MNAKGSIPNLGSGDSPLSYQPLSAELTALAALSTQSYGRSLLEVVSALALRSALGLVIGTDVLAPNGSGASLTALNATQLTSGTVPLARLYTTLAGYGISDGITAAAVAAGYQPLSSNLTLYAAITPSANTQSFLGAANYAAMRTQLGAGAASGLSTLDAGGKIPTSQIPDSVLGQVEYQGSYNASTNTPTLSASPGATTKGDYYVVSVAGTFDSVTYAVGDWIISNGTIWQKVDNTDLVTMVAGRTGAITLTTADIGGLGTIATQAASAVAITGGAINGTPIGATTPSTGAFTTLSTTGSISVADAANGILFTAGTGRVGGDATNSFLKNASAGGSILMQSSTNATIAAFTNSGLAVTGALSATGILSVAGGQYFSAGSSGTGAPTFTTRSAGTKVILYDQISGSSLPFSLGIDSGTLWLAAGGTSDTIKSYVGTSLITTVSSTGLAVTGTLTTSSTTLHTSSVSLTNGAAAAAGTLTNAPVAGNPTKWIGIVDNGVTRYIPAW